MINEEKLRKDLKTVITQQQRYSNGEEEYLDNLIKAVLSNCMACIEEDGESLVDND